MQTHTQETDGNPQPASAPGACSATRRGNQNPEVCCFRCLKWFRLPQTMGTDPYPIQCLHCGYMHTYHDARAALWPVEIYDKPNAPHEPQTPRQKP